MLLNTVDLLPLVGHKLCVEDYIDAIFEGLSQEYETSIISVSSRIDPYTTEEIEAIYSLLKKTVLAKVIKIQNCPILVLLTWPQPVDPHT